MTFSVFAVLMIIIVLLVAFIHMIQGFFSAAISAVLAIFSAVLALSYHEVLVEKLLGGRMADSAHAMMLLILFATIYLVLRVAFDSLVPGNIRLPAVADKVGGAILGAIAGIFGAGVVAVAAQEMSFFPAMMGYARYAVDSHDATVPGAMRGTESSVTDQMSGPEFNEADLQKMLLPVDDILIDTTKHLSEGGALSSEPLTRMHPDWLQELFGQRLGVEPGARRVLMSLPSAKAPEVRTDGVFLIGKNELPWIDSEFTAVRGSSKQKVKSKPLPAAAAPKPGEVPSGAPKTPPEYYETKPGTVLLVVRLRFSKDAAERNAGGLVRISPGSTRLVLPVDGKPEGEAAGYKDNYPIGTLEYRNYLPDKGRPRLPHFVMIGQNVDDFIFVATEPQSPEDTPGDEGGDGGVDFVYNISQQQLGWKNPPGGDPKLPAGAFIEVKRLGREDLSNHKVLPEADLYKDKSWESIRVLRKPLQMKWGLESQGFTDTGGTVAEAPSTPTPPTPTTPAPSTPTPSTPTPPAPATAALSLDVADDSARASDTFFTAVGTSGNEGPVTVAGASFTLAKPGDVLMIQSAKLDGVEAKSLRNGGPAPVSRLAPPNGMTLVQLIARPKGNDTTWAWKDQIGNLALVDPDNNASYPLYGAWAQYTDAADGATKLSARYSNDRSVPVNDMKPGGELKQVWLVFPVKPGAKIKGLVLGTQPVKDLAVDVP